MNIWTKELLDEYRKRLSLPQLDNLMTQDIVNILNDMADDMKVITNVSWLEPATCFQLTFPYAKKDIENE